MARVNTPGLIEACADGEATQAGTKTRISDRLFSLRHRGLRRSGGPTYLAAITNPHHDLLRCFSSRTGRGCGCISCSPFRRDGEEDDSKFATLGTYSGSCLESARLVSSGRAGAHRCMMSAGKEEHKLPIVRARQYLRHPLESPRFPLLR